MSKTVLTLDDEINLLKNSEEIKNIHTANFRK